MKGWPKKKGTGAGSWLLRASVGNVCFLYLPIVVLGLFSFNDSKLSAVWQGFSLRWYAQLLGDRALWDAFHNSMVVGVVSTVLATVLSVMAVVQLEHLAQRYQRRIEAAMIVPLVIPEIMMGVALMLFFLMVEIPLGLGTIIIGHTAMNIPIIMVILRAKMRKLDPLLLDAARDLGASPWNVFARVTFPLLRPTMLGAMLLAFTISLDDFIVAFFTAGPGSTTLPLKVYSMVKSGVSPEINALSALLVALSMMGIGLSMHVQRRGEQEAVE